ncbi:CDP-alcohol phosphatidyltransferase family protein [Flavobacteriaceae bacterium]|nr:CDP-alcohol phosphatidyltransferase family protein [Flavobacteriaceae bacterium]MDB4024306.1 CDP-alcohol phosphatidyltransferase family protein [Flavobacteriaceae bacterium]MDB4131201.1 CDP-alcohol phosphatidyltransferase family protein [Flavobacteriaceae bacterium]MDB4147817.1 CDP-alcohol phosphatidyltransferase family protein [bacterium]MDC0593462.1 CDP-alcohol phosphatidyltransferase family protein [Flavobacteriaceae bacterium]
MKIFNFIPNFLTLSNLFFGCIAVVYGVMGDLEKLALFVSLGIICDFFDGFFARLLKVDSKLGVQLDSLSDLVTFGLTSSIVMLNLIGSSSFVIDNSSNFIISLLPVSAFLITISSSYRLAKFNLSSVSETNFSGLPTPANAILIVFLPQFIERFQLELFFENIVVLMILVLISSYLLISNHKMFSLKISNLKLSQNKAMYTLFFSSVILLSCFGLASFTLIIILYIVLNLLRAIV